MAKKNVVSLGFFSALTRILQPGVFQGPLHLQQNKAAFGLTFREEIKAAVLIKYKRHLVRLILRTLFFKGRR